MDKAKEDDDGLRVVRSGRLLSLSVTHVEIRLYRSSRTSSDPLRQPAHFEYLVRCRWSSPGEAPAATGSGDDGCWWDLLPGCYTVRRRWAEIVKFHEAVDRDFAFDPKLGFRRTKARMPHLPDRGNLDSFVQRVAVSGDSMALSRGNLGNVDEELQDIHTIYVENRLRPYFKQVCQVMDEVPAEVLAASDVVRKFVTGGSASKPPPKSSSSWKGPAPVILSATDRTKLTRKLAALRATQGRGGDELGATLGGTLGSTLRGVSLGGTMGSTMFGGARASSSTALTTSPKAGAAGVWRGTARQVARSSAGSAPRPASSTGMASVSSPAAVLRKSLSATSFDAGFTAELALAAAIEDQGQGGDCEGSPPPMARITPLGGGYALTREARRASSHYGLFARQCGGAHRLGYSSERDLWKHMRIKERRELGRRTLLVVKDDSLGRWSKTTPGAPGVAERLPALHPPGSNDLFRASQERWATMEEARRSAASETMGSRKAGLVRGGETQKANTMARDIREGLRVVILGYLPLQDMRRIPEEDAHLDPSFEDTLKVYKTYRSVVKFAEDEAGEPLSDAPSEGDAEHSRQASREASGRDAGPNTKANNTDAGREEPLLESMATVSWTVLVAWSQRETDFARDFRYKSVCGALNRALKLWWQRAQQHQHPPDDVSLAQMFQWVWPSIGPERVSEMLLWVCSHELEKIRRPTPPVIEPQERRQLEVIFKTLDPEGRGYCTAEDIAGGQAKLKNLVDVDTVRAVVPERKIRPIRFLELMCEDGSRAHEGATKVVQSNGTRVVHRARQAVGFNGWVYDEDDVPPEEVPQRRLCDSLEAEVLRWRRIASFRPVAGFAEATLAPREAGESAFGLA